MADAIIEIWQTDSNGAYDHPNASRAGIDEGFQHFGADASDSAAPGDMLYCVKLREGSRNAHAILRA